MSDGFASEIVIRKLTGEYAPNDRRNYRWSGSRSALSGR